MYLICKPGSQARVELLVAALLSLLTISASFDLGPIENPFDKLFNFLQTPDGEKLEFMDYLLEDFLPPLYGQRANNENGTRNEFKEYALTDTSNDDATHLTGVSIIS